MPIILSLLCLTTVGSAQTNNHLAGSTFLPAPFANLADSFNNKPLIPSAYYATQLGFFCKQELKFEKATMIPLKIRLGDIEYCDWKEGKKTSTYRPNY